jgi:transcription elongation factor SPT5
VELIIVLSLQEPIDFKNTELRKFFKVGTHVKVLSGLHTGVSGTVVSIKDELAKIMADATGKTFQAFVKDLQSTLEVTRTAENIGNFKQFDLVSLDATTVGIVVKVDYETVKVLDQDGTIRTLYPRDISVRPARASMAVDAKGASIERGTPVRLLLNPYQGREGIVKHVYRSSVFVLVREIVENSGIVVARPQQVESLAIDHKVCVMVCVTV